MTYLWITLDVMAEIRDGWHQFLNHTTARKRLWA